MINIEILSQLTGNHSHCFIKLCFHVLGFESEFHTFFFILLAIRTIGFTDCWFLHWLLFFLFNCTFVEIIVCLHNGIELSLKTLSPKLWYFYNVFSFSYATFNPLYLEANSLIFLSFIPWPSSLAKISVSNCYVLSHFIYSWTCWRMVLVCWGGFGGKGVPVVRFCSKSESSSSSSENAFFMGFLKLFLEPICSVLPIIYLDFLLALTPKTISSFVRSSTCYQALILLNSCFEILWQTENIYKNQLSSD